MPSTERPLLASEVLREDLAPREPLAVTADEAALAGLLEVEAAAFVLDDGTERGEVIGWNREPPGWLVDGDARGDALGHRSGDGRSRGAALPAAVHHVRREEREIRSILPSLKLGFRCRHGSLRLAEHFAQAIQPGT